MGIGRDSRHKRNLTGARRNVHKKKRKYELGRPAAMTRIGQRRIRLVRTLGGNTKRRALRLDSGTFSWGTESTFGACGGGGVGGVVVVVAAINRDCDCGCDFVALLWWLWFGWLLGAQGASVVLRMIDSLRREMVVFCYFWLVGWLVANPLYASGSTGG